jgi:hypothetical protein
MNCFLFKLAFLIGFILSIAIIEMATILTQSNGKLQNKE